MLDFLNVFYRELVLHAVDKVPLALYQGCVCTDFTPLLSFSREKKSAKKSALFKQGISHVATCDLWLRPKNPQTFEKV